MKTYKVSVNRKAHYVKVLKSDGSSFYVDVNGKTVEVKLANFIEGKTIFLEVNGRKIQAELIKTFGNALHVKIGGKIFEVQYPTPAVKKEGVKIEPSSLFPKKFAAGLTGKKDAVLAPIAGRIVTLKVNVGQKVSKGDCVCILEAMKMANEVAAPKDGIVKEILVSNGAIVNKGDVLAVIA
ncbi:MAG: biotin/lipoyl-containing protein [Candidatus Bathycorpusculaceae bacterium]